MRAMLRLRVPEDAEATITLTATIKELEELEKCISDSYPGWRFGAMLSTAIRKAQESFHAEDQKIDA